MIFDAFIFFDELECLEIRLHELDAVVDYFVIVEATKTISNKPKALFYSDNWDRFKKFHRKIIHVVVNDMPNADNPVFREIHQRNCLKKALMGVCKPDDIVLVSDADEIASPVAIKQYRPEIGPIMLGMNYYLYYLDNRVVTTKNSEIVTVVWGGTRIANWQAWQTLDARFTGQISNDLGGWHFSFLGGIDRIKQKAAAYLHHKEMENNTDDFLRKCLESGTHCCNGCLEVNGMRYLTNTYKDSLANLPQYVRDNSEIFKSMLL